MKLTSGVIQNHRRSFLNKTELDGNFDVFLLHKWRNGQGQIHVCCFFWGGSFLFFYMASYILNVHVYNAKKDSIYLQKMEEQEIVTDKALRHYCHYLCIIRTFFPHF